MLSVSRRAWRKSYLLRLFVNETVDPAVVATLYRTSKIKKYWRTV